jgi:hypothetical protein|tara:strand:- start:1033 stop:1608 length:576 start_codon:yes stop_codon:yes gene_type:complete
MDNIINSGSLEALTPGNSLLVQSRQVANGKIQLELAERLEGAAQANPLAVFNKSDERFSQGGARRAWLTCEPADAAELLGVDLTNGYSPNEMGQMVKPLNISNPTVGGTPLRVEIIETIEPTEWQMANLQTAAKRRGKDGEYITHNGCYIFANSRVCFGEAQHVFLEADAVTKTTGGIPAGVNVQTGELMS